MILRKLLSVRWRYTGPMAQSYLASLSKRRLYGGVIILWLVITSATLALYLTSSLRAMQLQFHHVESAVYDQIAYQLSTTEAVLDGFAAFHSESDSVEQTRTRRYVRRVLTRFPHIQSLQVIQRVSPGEVAGLELRMHRSGFPHFRVHAPGRQNLPPSPMLYPLVFVEPLPAGFDRIMGATTEGLPLASQMGGAAPVPLDDGRMAYAISRKASLDRANALDRFEREFGTPLYVRIVVRADALRPQHIALPKGMRLILRYRQPSIAAPLFDLGQLRSGWLQQRLFPRLTLARELGGDAQPFVLECQWQIGWNNVDLPVVLALLALASFALLSLLLLVRRLHLIETRRVERESELYDLAIHDPLTGLFNRYYLERHLRRAIEEHRRHHARFGLVYIDLDRFKPVNDIYGHETGDQVLRVVAARLRNVVRQRDTVARIGGDEFVVLFEGVSSLERIQELTSALSQALTQPIRLDAGIFEIGASTGVAFFPEDGGSVDQLLMVADKLMYATKQLKKQREAAGDAAR